MSPTPTPTAALTRTAILAAVFTLLGCESGGADDAGVTGDAGPAADTGAAPDSGSSTGDDSGADSGAPADSGPGVDSSTSPGAECLLVNGDDGLSVWGVDGTSYGVIRDVRYLDTTISPDGERVAVYDYTADAIEVFAFDGSGGTVVAADVGRGYVAWSPDGTRLAFMSQTTYDVTLYAADGSGSLGTVEGTTREGSPDRQLGQVSAASSGIAWVGDELVYPCRAAASGCTGSCAAEETLGPICSVPVGGGAATVIWRPSPTRTSGAVVHDASADGRAVSIEVRAGMRSSLDPSRPVFPGLNFVVGPDGRNLRELAEVGRAFSPDGTQLITNNPLATIPATGGGSATPLPAAFPDELFPVDWGLRCP